MRNKKVYQKVSHRNGNNLLDRTYRIIKKYIKKFHAQMVIVYPIELIEK